MTASGSVFSEALKEITKTKLDELSKRRQSFEEAKAAVLAFVQEEQNPVTRLEKLSLGVKECFGLNWTQNHQPVGVPYEDSGGRHARLTTELKEPRPVLGTSPP